MSFYVDSHKKHVIEPEVIVDHNIEFVQLQLSLFEVEVTFVLSFLNVSLQRSNKIFTWALQGLGVCQHSLAISVTETSQSFLGFFGRIRENKISSEDFSFGENLKKIFLLLFQKLFDMMKQQIALVLRIFLQV